MDHQTDQQLLRDYVERRRETAFTELVQRHVDLVYSAALRMVRDRHLAEDVTQGVFVALAANAAILADHPVLSGWLHCTARNLAAKSVRSNARRSAREQEAATMNELLTADSEPAWETITPHLDAALGELSPADRDALMLRYFEKKSAPEMAGMLGISNEAAQKRVSRGMERLRELLVKHGVTVGTTGLVVAITANAVQTAPAGLAATISAAAFAGAAVSTSTIIATTKTIAMTTLQKVFVGTVLTAVIGTGIYEAHLAGQLRAQLRDLQHQQAANEAQIQQLQRERDALAAGQPPGQKIEQSTANQTSHASALTNDTASQSFGTSVAPGSASPKFPAISLPKAAWADTGFATPEAVLKTRGWAVLNGNRERFAESLAITPGARKLVEDMLVQMASASKDPERDKLIQEALKNKWGVEEAILMPMMALNQQNEFTGYRMLTEDSPADGEMVVQLETDMASAAPQTETLKLRRFGGDWKIVVDEDAVRGH